MPNEWKIACAYDINEQKETTADYLNETGEFTKDGESDIVDDAGTWDFISDKEEISISIGMDVDKFKILRLKENEIWLKSHDEDLHLVTQ